MADPDAIAAPTATETLGGIDIALLTPLEKAAGTGAAQSTAALLVGSEISPFDVTAAEERPLGRTVLHWAAFGGNPEVVSVVLQRITEDATAASISQRTAASSNENDTPAGTPVNVAAAVEEAAVTALRATCMGSSGGPGGTTPLHLAAEHGHAAAAVVLLDAGAVATHKRSFTCKG